MNFDYTEAEEYEAEKTTMNITKPIRQSARQNHLLAALPATEFASLRPHLELVQMPLGCAVHEPGDLQRYVYFPTTSIVTLLQVLEDGFSAAIAVVGNEGMVGIASFMGGESTPSHSVVLCEGYAYRLSASVLTRLFEQSRTMRDLLLRYTQALIAQTTQTAACNRYHLVEQQLCRFLLQCSDRLPSREMVMTQELIANTLGVRREGISSAARTLQAKGAIHCRRGHIAVLDRRKLEAEVCECYAVVKHEYDRLLPGNRHTAFRPAIAAKPAIRSEPMLPVAA